MKSLQMLALLPAFFLGACALEPLPPWDRDLLAQDQMQLIPHPVNAYITEHIYFSKEAASGGVGVGGGGCGCN